VPTLKRCDTLDRTAPDLSEAREVFSDILTTTFVQWKF
jgi:hypothetical protein